MNKTKLAMIEHHLRNGSLNTFEAIRLGDTCLNTTVSNLRAKGINVVSDWESVPNRFGGMTKVKRYRIIEGNKKALNQARS